MGDEAVGGEIEAGECGGTGNWVEAFAEDFDIWIVFKNTLKPIGAVDVCAAFVLETNEIKLVGNWEGWLFD